MIEHLEKVVKLFVENTKVFSFLVAAIVISIPIAFAQKAFFNINTAGETKAVLIVSFIGASVSVWCMWKLYRWFFDKWYSPTTKPNSKSPWKSKMDE